MMNWRNAWLRTERPPCAWLCALRTPLFRPIPFSSSSWGRREKPFVPCMSADTMPVCCPTSALSTWPARDLWVLASPAQLSSSYSITEKTNGKGKSLWFSLSLGFQGADGRNQCLANEQGEQRTCAGVEKGLARAGLESCCEWRL